MILGTTVQAVGRTVSRQAFSAHVVAHETALPVRKVQINDTHKLCSLQENGEVILEEKVHLGKLVIVSQYWQKIDWFYCAQAPRHFP